MIDPSTPFVLSLAVRDYECDIEGIVNNAVYLNYLEHARHECLKAAGITFIELHRSGFDPVVTRIEIDYRRALLSGDEFRVLTTMRLKGLVRFVFEQSIVRISDEVIVTDALVTATFISGGRPVAPPPSVMRIFETQEDSTE